MSFYSVVYYFMVGSQMWLILISVRRRWTTDPVKALPAHPPFLPFHAFIPAFSPLA